MSAMPLEVPVNLLSAQITTNTIFNLFSLSFLFLFFSFYLLFYSSLSNCHQYTTQHFGTLSRVFLAAAVLGEYRRRGLFMTPVESHVPGVYQNQPLTTRPS